ncbi:hypothetical protein RvY_19146 [Ramazzottius varieornatus]|uniref:Uncharacterized protein n=1 Tax=Ramazzottius varieornatus TaxID=947166 RepID=A0A1D1W8D1_RAMVA|nr:hypothetical protein RvY_19146 [Ramazzottius varieornatus]
MSQFNHPPKSPKSQFSTPLGLRYVPERHFFKMATSRKDTLEMDIVGMKKANEDAQLVFAREALIPDLVLIC